MSVRVLVADDHEVVRMGVKVLLAGNPQWEVCGEASNGIEAVAKVAELSPDMVILDLSMPIMNGFAAAAEIRRLAPKTKIILLSLHETPVTARLVGADAFVAKASAARDLETTMRDVWQPRTIAPS